MTSSSIQSITTSNPSILVTSDPSIRVDKKNSKLLNTSLILLVIVALIALACSIVVALQKIEQNKQLADQAQAAANAVKHITPTVVSKKMDNIEQPIIEEDSSEILFTLLTTPSGAEVYQDGLFIGNTPIEDKKMKKSSEPSQFIISLNGYVLERKSYTLDESFSGSELITLTKDVVRQTTNNSAASAAQESRDVMANDAVVITTQQENKPVRHNKNKNDKGNAPAAPADTGIVLPL